ncbi:hypothetical protein BJ165DRAFT_1489062 [Panaeolus papilionaceus]|nr:hypothetical protein BJ165DRAFT_1489062 [Panaeolus papilionaceus]
MQSYFQSTYFLILGAFNAQHTLSSTCKLVVRQDRVSKGVFVPATKLDNTNAHRFKSLLHIVSHAVKPGHHRNRLSSAQKNTKKTGSTSIENCLQQVVDYTSVGNIRWRNLQMSFYGHATLRTAHCLKGLSLLSLQTKALLALGLSRRFIPNLLIPILPSRKRLLQSSITNDAPCLHPQ